MGALEALPNHTPVPAPVPQQRPSASRLDEVLRVAQVVAAGGLFGTYRGRPEAAATVMLQAVELGLSPLQGLTSIHLVEGKPTVSAELMRGLVLQAGHDIRIVEMTDQVCRLAGRRAGQDDDTMVTFTMDDARRAGVAGRPPWKQYPQAMLLARATTMLCRAVFPDVLHGVSYTPEELDRSVEVEVLDVEADVATGEQLEVIVELKDELGLDDATLAAGIVAVTDGRATGLADLSMCDADLVAARMANRAERQGVA